MKNPDPATMRNPGYLERNTGFEPATFALARRPGQVAKTSQDSQAVPNSRNSSGRSAAAASSTVPRTPAIASGAKDFSTPFLPDSGVLLTVKEVARILRVSTASVYKLCGEGRLPHARVLNAIRIAPADLQAFITARP